MAPDPVLLGVIVGFPVLALAAGAAYVYRDAPTYGMNPYRWAAVAFFVPFFGFFAYLFERDERRPGTNDRDEMFVDGPFEIHRSRADDVPFATGDGESTDDVEAADDAEAESAEDDPRNDER